MVRWGPAVVPRPEGRFVDLPSPDSRQDDGGEGIAVLALGTGTTIFLYQFE
jgi:hypothetical protein